MSGHILLAVLLITAAAILTGCESDQRSIIKYQETNRTRFAPQVEQSFADPTQTPLGIESKSTKNLSQLEGNSVCATQSTAILQSKESLIGEFTPPTKVPKYEILELGKDVKETGRSSSKVAKIMVDTSASDVSAYTLITKDIKAVYSDYDVVTIEFTDLTTGAIPYNGGALIFNTACGALYVGYVYGPPEKGYVVEAGKIPSLYPSHPVTGSLLK